MNTVLFFLIFLLTLAVSYLLGSINFAIILSRLMTHDDVRRHGSGNAGTTNMIRTAGALPGALTLLGDFVKGAAAILIGRYLAFPWLAGHAPEALAPFLHPEYGVYLSGIFCQLGHIFPVFFGFKGGKGVATTLGIMMFIDWRAALLALAVFIILFAIFRIVSLGSVAAAASLPLFTFLLTRADYNMYNLYLPSRWYIPTILSAVLGLIIILKHVDNIKRLMRGEEKKLSLKKHD